MAKAIKVNIYKDLSFFIITKNIKSDANNK